MGVEAFYCSKRMRGLSYAEGLRINHSQTILKPNTNNSLLGYTCNREKRKYNKPYERKESLMKKLMKALLCALMALILTCSAVAFAENEVEITNSYDNTAELLESFPVINPTPVEPGIGEAIQNRLLSGFENWNRGFDAWKAWGDILYTEDSIYNVHGARLTLAEYQAAMNVTLSQVDIQMGNFNNMIICDDWCAIRYDITTIVGENAIPGTVMEFVKFADYGEALGTRVVEGWGGTKDEGYDGMAMFRGEENTAIQQEQFDALIAWEIPDTDDLAQKYPVLHPTTDNSEWADAIRAALLQDFDAWNQGYDVWAENADSFYSADALCAGADAVQLSVDDYKAAIKARFETETTTRKYFDSMLISGEWAATHYRTVTIDNETGETTCADRMQFFRFAMTDDGIKVTESWLM